MHALNKWLATLLLAGGLADTQPAAAAPKYKVLYSFKGGSDGAGPNWNASLINVGGTLYGTTGGGGASGQGTVFSITPSGTEKVIYAFQGGSDGATPLGSLTYAGGVLFGTTYGGGAGSSGTIFQITTAGVETVLHALARATDGASPVGGVIDAGGTLYGTAVLGGAYANGTVFKLPKGGAFSVLHAFTGSSGSDGSEPSAGLVAVGRAFYGTTVTGGAGGCFDGAGCGTVFRITPAGAETVLYDFKNAPDANEPEGGLIRAGGTLFGTTGLGGTGTDSGCGTVFGVTKAGAEHVVYSFKCGNDGEVPYGSLIEVGGAFYGTTLGGGPSMDGTVFKVTRAGAHTVLHAFSGGSDGAIPYAGLVNLNGTLYGTTLRGGANNAGTVFAITP